MFLIFRSNLEELSTRRDRNFLSVLAGELAEKVRLVGPQAVEQDKTIEISGIKRIPLYLRILKDRTVIFQRNPEHWKAFRVSNEISTTSPAQAVWTNIESSENDDEILELYTIEISPHYYLQLGRNTRDREDRDTRFLLKSVLTVSIAALFLIVAGGAISHLILRPIRNLIEIVSSITNGKEGARVEVSQTNDELNDLAKLFNKMLDRNDALVLSMKESLDNVAHDLRTPITRLRMSAANALEKNLSLDECKNALSDCLDESERIHNMLTVLLGIAEAEAGAMTLNYETIDLHDLLSGMAEFYHDSAEEKNVTVTFGAWAELQTVADRTRLLQVVNNLLDNAIKYTPSGGHVSITAERIKRDESSDDEILLIQVADTGIGISEQDLPRIWERLFRGDRSRNERGLGLGLSLVKAIVKAHGWHIEVETKIDKGSVFRIYLPKKS